MKCHEFEEVLERQIAEQLPADAAAHLNDCGPCRALVSDMEAIRVSARRLALDEMEPPERVWLSLRAQLESEGLIRTPGKTHRDFGSLRGWLGGWPAVLPRPVLAGVYVSFLLIAAVLIGVQGDLRQNRAAPSGVAQLPSASLGEQLISVERRTVLAMRQRDPVVAASLRRNLDIVDNFIRLCEKSVREEPQNQEAREYLYGAYQQKAELLAAVMERGATGD